MSEHQDPWAEVERRAALSGAQGVTSDSDDLLDDSELGEAAINPNSSGGKGPGKSGSGMMPPMMMGGRGGAAGAGPVGAGGGVVDPGMGQAQAMGAAGMARGAAPGTAAAAGGLAGGPGGLGAAGSASGLGAAGSSGALGSGAMGSGGLSAGSFGAGGGVLAAGAGPGDVNGDGIPDRFVAGGIDVDGDGVADLPSGAAGGGSGEPFGVGGSAYDRMPASGVNPGSGSSGSGSAGSGNGGNWDFGGTTVGQPGASSGSGSAHGGGSTSGMPTGGGGFSSDTAGGSTGGSSGTQVMPDGGIRTPQTGAGTYASGGSGSGSGGSFPAGGTSSGGVSTGGFDGYRAETGGMRANASRWADVASQMKGLVNSSGTGANFGLVASVEPSYNHLAEATKKWTADVGVRFDSMDARLSSSAKNYEDTEAANAAIAGGIND